MHDCPEYTFLQTLLVLALKQKRTYFGLGLELKKNTLFHNAQSFLSDEEAVRVMEEDKDHRMAMEISHDVDDPMSVLLHYCLKRNVSTRFNDAATTRESTAEHMKFDYGDAQVRRCIAQFGSSREELESSFSIAALTLRNVIIVENAGRHRAEIGTNLYLQHCGAAYAVHWPMGRETTSIRYEDALPGMFRAAGWDAIVASPCALDNYRSVDAILGWLYNCPITKESRAVMTLRHLTAQYPSFGLCVPTDTQIRETAIQRMTALMMLRSRAA